MFDFVSPIPKYLFGAILIAIIAYVIMRSVKKDREARLYDCNLASLPSEARKCFDALKQRDFAWYEEFGNSLDATESSDPLHVAVEAGWSSMDDLEELLKNPRFVDDAANLEQFLEKLKFVLEQFAIADAEKANRAENEEEA